MYPNEHAKLSVEGITLKKVVSPQQRKLLAETVKQQISFDYTQPGKPQQNACVKHYNRTVRHELLQMHDFRSIEHAQNTETNWL